MPDAAEPTTWYLTTALIVGPAGQASAISGLNPSTSEREARLAFAENLLDQYGPKGWAVREVMATALSHLVISRAAGTESEAEAA